MLKLAVTLALLAVAVHASNPPPNMQGGFSSQMFFNELPWGRNNPSNTSDPISNWVGQWYEYPSHHARMMMINQSYWMMRQVQKYNDGMIYFIVDSRKFCQKQAIDKDDKYQSLFSWTPYSNYIGDNFVDAVPVETYTVATATNNIYINLLKSRGLPYREVVQDAPTQRTQVFDFRGFSWGEQNPGLLTVPSYCHDSNIKAKMTTDDLEQLEKTKQLLSRMSIHPNVQ